MIQCEGNYDTVRFEGVGSGRIEEGQQGLLGMGSRRVSACRGDRDGTVEARMVGLCAIIYALY